MPSNPVAEATERSEPSIRQKEPNASSHIRLSGEGPAGAVVAAPIASVADDEDDVPDLESDSEDDGDGVIDGAGAAEGSSTEDFPLVDEAMWADVQEALAKIRSEEEAAESLAAADAAAVSTGPEGHTAGTPISIPDGPRHSQRARTTVNRLGTAPAELLAASSEEKRLVAVFDAYVAGVGEPPPTGGIASSFAQASGPGAASRASSRSSLRSRFRYSPDPILLVANAGGSGVLMRYVSASGPLRTFLRCWYRGPSCVVGRRCRWPWPAADLTPPCAVSLNPGSRTVCTRRSPSPGSGSSPPVGFLRRSRGSWPMILLKGRRAWS